MGSKRLDSSQSSDEIPNIPEDAADDSRGNNGSSADSFDTKGKSVPVGNVFQQNNADSSLPGTQAFGSLNNIAPFMMLWHLYASHLYPKKDSEARYHAFVKDHPHVTRVCFTFDFIVRIFLVSLVFIVMLRGLSLLPWSCTN